jgi:hypothetical protein
MKRFVPLWILACAGIVLVACGEDPALSGSECDIISCDYDKIVCQRYDTNPPGIIIHYKRVLEEGGERWTAKIFIDLDGIETVEGYLFEDDENTLQENEFTNRVTLTRPGEDEQWPDFDGKDCKISKGGDVTDQKMEGECNFAFINGYFLTAKFSCTLEAAIPP